MRRVSTVFTLSLVTFGCAGGQSGDPGNVDGEPDTTVLEPDCEVTRWLPSEPEPSTYRCEVADGRSPPSACSPTNQNLEGEQTTCGVPVAWACDCAGESLEVEETSCRAAIEQACDVDPEAARYCDYPIATCFPEDEEGSSWLCRCGEEGSNPGREVEHVPGDDCSSAALAACGSSCNGELGSCVNQTSSAQDFECTCEAPAGEASTPTFGSARSKVAVSADTCDVALADACGGGCESEMGSCTYSDGAFTCRCEDETAATVAVSDLPRPEDSETGEACGDALVQACGNAGMRQECSSVNAEWSGSCAGYVGRISPGEAPPELTDFDCTCDNAADAGPTSSTVTVATSSCEDAVQQACPAAVRPGSDPGGPTLDYGHPCDEDDDCSAGACYVPGTRVNSICSKRCEVDSDCPEFAQCFAQVGGYCFVRCTEDAECLALSPAIANALHCLEQPPSAEAGLCIQGSEP